MKRRNRLAKGKLSFFFSKFEKFVTAKRQRFVISVIFLSTLLFIIQQMLGRTGIVPVFLLAIATDILLFLGIKDDLKGNFALQVFILPFFFTLSFGLFYLLVPARLLTRIVITTLYALGLYSLFLSENIFTVSSMRTIALLSSARTVAFTITLLSYFFLTNVVFSLHFNVLLTLGLVFLFTFPLIAQSLWMHTLNKNILADGFWVFALTLCLFELSILLWFWPSTPTLIALFLTGIFYTIIGLTQSWFDKRLFKGLIWEYLIVSAIVLFVFVIYTSWV